MAARLIPAVKQAKKRQEKLLQRQRQASKNATLAQKYFPRAATLRSPAQDTSNKSTPSKSAQPDTTSKRETGQRCGECREVLHSFTVPDSRFSCDRCDKAIALGMIVLSCRDCDYDLCAECQELSDLTPPPPYSVNNSCTFNSTSSSTKESTALQNKELRAVTASTLP